MARIQTLDRIIDSSLGLAIAGAFFILPSITIAGRALPQLFYVFTGVVIAAALYKIYLSAQYRQHMLHVLRRWGFPIGLFLTFGLIGAFLYSAQTSFSGSILDFDPDFPRVVVLLILSFIIIAQGSENQSHLRWAERALFVPLLLFPVLFIVDVQTATSAFPDGFFAGYKLQGFQNGNPTSLAAWLIVAFAFTVTPLFGRALRPSRRIVFLLLSMVLMALMWWTNSRAALIGAVLLIAILAVRAHRRRALRLSILFCFSFAILIGSLALLPQQARTVVFLRYYPQYYPEAMSNELKIPGAELARAIFSQLPTFIAHQDRGRLWRDCPMVILTHPLGSFGPSLPIPHASDGCLRQHNSLFQAAAWGGWVTMIVIVYLLVYAARIGWYALRGDDDTQVRLALAFLGVVIFAMLNSFLQFKLFWLLPALMIARLQKESSEHKERSL